MEVGVGRPTCGGGMWSGESGGLKSGGCESESKMCGLWVGVLTFVFIVKLD